MTLFLYPPQIFTVIKLIMITGRSFYLVSKLQNVLLLVLNFMKAVKLMFMVLIPVINCRTNRLTYTSRIPWNSVIETIIILLTLFGYRGIVSRYFFKKCPYAHLLLCWFNITVQCNCRMIALSKPMKLQIRQANIVRWQHTPIQSRLILGSHLLHRMRPRITRIDADRPSDLLL